MLYRTGVQKAIVFSVGVCRALNKCVRVLLQTKQPVLFLKTPFLLLIVILITSFPILVLSEFQDFF